MADDIDESATTSSPAPLSPLPPPPKLSPEDLRDLIDVLRAPLSDRPVLIPLGPRAFVAGTLAPAVAATRAADAAAASDEGRDTHAGDDEERVVFRDAGGARHEIPRLRAKELLERERREALGMKAATMQQAAAESGREPQPRRLEPTVPRPSPTASSSQASARPPPRRRHGSSPGFVEIREELDGAGREVRAEAVDVSRLLRQVERAARDGGPSDDDDDSVEEGEGTHRDDDDYSSGDAGSATTSIKPLNDEEYAKLAARLDELARLEEEAEEEASAQQRGSMVRNAPVTKKKPKHGSGWAKGFLNQPKADRKPTTTTTGGSHVDPAPAPSPEPSPPQKQQSASAAEPFALPTRRVAFGETHVREIPRIGQRPASEIRPKAAVMHPPQAVVGERSVVRERTRPSSLAEAAPQTSSMAAEPTTRRLSRFAQERRQLR